MATMSISGVISGMDWDSMIDEIITNAAKPAQVQVSKKKNLTNKKSLFEEMKVTMNSLQSSLTPLKLPSTYKAKQVDIERIDSTGSYKGVLTATVNADAEVNVYDLKVNKLARAQTNRSRQITASSVGSALSEQGLNKGTMYINMMGQKVGIDISSNDSLQTIKSKINNTLKTLDIPLGVTASVVDNRLILRSDSTGLGANSLTETLTYNLNNRNTITSFNVSDSDLKNGNFVIRNNNGNKLTYGKDYDLVNGNEIRWNQYEETDNVKLGKSVTATYKIGKGDIYESTGTYGSGEAKISALTVKDDGTLSSRLKIVDEDDNEYVYGKDFTLDSSNNVVWLKEEEATTNEPSSYTITYTKTGTQTYEVTGEKINPLQIPESFTVSYDRVLEGTVSSALTSSTALALNNQAQVAGNLPKYTEFRNTYGLSVLTGTTTLDFNGSDADKLEIVVDGEVSSDYSYGTNYKVRPAEYWPSDQYYGQGFAAIEWTSSSKPADGYTIRYTHTYSASSGDSSFESDLSSVITEAGTDTGSIKITGSDGTVYEQGTHYDIKDGQIVWKTQDQVIDVTNDQFTELQTKYAEAYKLKHGTSSELSTVTRIDGDGVLRTYVDPDDPDIFTMSAGGQDYVYGRDYVLRVNDAGTGYRFDWLVEDSDTITDANKTVATYAAYKDISTSEWKAAPAEGTAYEFGFSYETTTTEKASVKSTDADKSLASLFEGITIDSSEYESVLKITSGTKTYEYGTDWTVDEDGNIAWIETSSDAEIPEHPESGTGYTLIYDPYSGIVSSLTYGDEDTQEAVLTVSSGKGNIGGTKLSYEQILSDMVSDASSGIAASLTYEDEDTQEAVLTVSSGKGNIGGVKLSYEQILSDTGVTNSSELAEYFSLTDEDGNEYVYGTDYRIISGTNADSSSGEHSPLIEWLSVPVSGTGFNLVYTGRNAGSTDSLGDSEFAKYFSLTDENGIEYEYGTDYRIISGTNADSSSGEHSPLIEWLSVPASDTGFTLAYKGRSDDTAEFSIERSYTDAVMTGDSGTAPLYSYFDGGTSTIIQGAKTFYEGIDYEITEGDNGNALVEWKAGTKSEWYYPTSNANYTINLTASNGRSYSFSGVRTPYDTLDLRNYGFTSVNGSISSVSYTGSETHSYDITSSETAENMSREIGLEVVNSTNGGFNTFNFSWVLPERTANADLPALGEEFSADYTYNENTFTLSDDSDGKLITALEFDQKDSEHYTAAQNAELELDGETITRESNDIGEAYDNELIKGMTIHLKGTGEVSLDVSHDAEKAVESIQTFVDTYNDLMTWMNTRMTESAVDKDTAATIDSDDFRMRWGLLHGNAILRQTKAKMRSLTSQNFTFSFTQRSSAEEIYGTMGYNGLRNDATLRLRINSKFVDVSILPTDTLQDIVNKINDDSEDGPMHDIFYDDNGNKLAQPLLKASIENDKLVINSTGNDSITMSGTSAMNVLKMNYTYKGLYQVGIATTSTDYGKSGELEFDTGEFMEALEDNADEVQELMLMFANDFDAWTKSMLTTSASGETSGTLTREIENLDNQIKTIDEYLERYQERLDKQEESLRTRYGNTETQLAKLSQQANAIASILNQLNGYNNNNNNSSSN